MDEYNFEDFDYAPEELEKEYTLRKNDTNTKVDKKASKQTDNINIGKLTADEYGGFEDFGNDSVEEIADVNIDDIYSNRVKELEDYKQKQLKENSDFNIKDNSNKRKQEPESQKKEYTNDFTSNLKDLHLNDEFNALYKNSPKGDNEDMNTISAILTNHNNNSKLMMNEYSNISRLADVKGNNNHVLSRMQVVEKKYVELKEEINKVIGQSFPWVNKEDTLNTEEKSRAMELVTKQNLELIKYLDKLNQIVNNIVDNSKVPVRNPNFSNKQNNHNNNNQINKINTANNKLLEVYKTEYAKLDFRFKQVSDPSYEEKVEESLNELNSLITFYEQENKKLKNMQKQSEVQFDRQYKNNVVSNVEIKKINQDYENIKKLNEMVIEKIQKNKVQISDNENKIKELNDWHTKLETIAKDMYGISDYNNVKDEDKTEKLTNEKKQSLRKKMEVLEKVMNSNKKKYEAEITRNEKTIVNLEKNKIELMKLLKEKSIQAYKSHEQVKGIYNKYDENSVFTPEIFGENYNTNDLLVLNKIINGKIENLSQNTNTEVLDHRKNLINNEKYNEDKDKIIDIEEKESNGRSINKMNPSNASFFNENHNISSNSPNNNNSINISKKDILRELEKKTSNDSQREKKNDESSNIPNLPNTNTNNTNSSNSSSHHGSNRFKPNFKFNNNASTNNHNNNANTVTNNNAKPMNIIDSNENLNYNAVNNEDSAKKKYDIKNEIITELDETSSKQFSRNVEIIMDKGLVANNNVKDNNEIPELNEEEHVFNSRRKGNTSMLTNKENSVNNKSVQHGNTNNNSMMNQNQNNSNKTNSNPNNGNNKSNIPSFLQDYQTPSKNEDNEKVSTLNNSNIGNNSINSNNRRVPQNNSNNNITSINKKPVSIFEEAFTKDNDDHDNKKSNTIIENKIKLDNSIEDIDLNLNNNTNNTYYDKKKKEDFDNLFKDQIEINTTTIAGNNLMFNNNNNKNIINMSNRNRGINSNNTLIENDKKSDTDIVKKTKQKNILDELEEIVL